MGLRGTLIDYSRGNDLRWLWRFYRWKSRARSRTVRDFFTFFMSRCAHRHGGYIGPDAVFEGIPSLPHGLHGVFISRYARIGAACRIYQNVTIGEVDGQAPAIGTGCLIGAGAVLVGGIRVGDGARIGAGAVVHTDVPAGCTVVAQPARILPRGDRQ
ncbi:MAG: serine acetyltransferase [Oscillospiraceae bacterium]|nr:serine acetyltransferase [Oscillospiraceae bacterium]